MAATLTPNYGWVQPEVGGDATTWGNELNNDLALIDAQVFSNESGVLPVGSGALWFTNTPPNNWLLCNGASLATASYPALFAAIGYTFGGAGVNFNLPNLTGVFPFGAGAGVALGATGGEATHVLVPAETPVHNHGVTDPTHNHGDPGHAHGVTDPTHGHEVGAPSPFLDGQVGVASGVGWGWGQVPTGGAATGISINAATTGIQAAATGISTQNAGGGGPHNNMPPFVGVNFIIRYR